MLYLLFYLAGGCKLSEKHYYRCKNGDCIKKQWQCDREKDCDDGDDEIGCGELTIMKFCIVKHVICMWEGIASYVNLISDVTVYWLTFVDYRCLWLLRFTPAGGGAVGWGLILQI